MEPFCISSTILGSDRHMLVADDGYSTSSALPRDVWFLNGVLDPTKPLCLDSLLKLGGRDVDVRPPEKWTRSMSLLTSGSVVPWSQTMPSTAYRSFVKNLVKSVSETIDDLPKEYYKETWCPAGQLLVGLKAARVDGALYREVSAASERDSGALETFRPGPGGFLPPVVYDRFATRTGRLTVSSGPNILTLRKDYRKLLRSSFPDGVICSLDFAALEARIILAEAGVECHDSDLYSALSEKLFQGKIGRDVVKVAVISELYGSSKHALGARLGLAGRKLEEFIDTIHRYFKTSDLRKRLKEEFKSTGKIRNRHGRFLDLDDPQDHLFVNTYAQSTGVDVALLGFKHVMDRLGTDGVRPLFVLHDALILDVRKDRLDDVAGVDSTRVPKYNVDFSLKFEEISSVQSRSDNLDLHS